ncbi:MAG: hypothetical protein ACJ8BW_40665 [Ktedonobacteraceae bacterium]
MQNTLYTSNFSSIPSAHWCRFANDHKPLNVAGVPQFELCRQVAVVIQARVAHPAKMALIRLKFHRVARELLLVVIQDEHILEDINLDRLSGQVPFPVQQEVPEARIPRFVESARFTVELAFPNFQLAGFLPLLAGS